MTAVLLDSCVLIDHLRGRPEAIAYLDARRHLWIKRSTFPHRRHPANCRATVASGYRQQQAAPGAGEAHEAVARVEPPRRLVLGVDHHGAGGDLLALPVSARAHRAGAVPRSHTHGTARSTASRLISVAGKDA